jgi:hypothetical protein
VGGDALAAAGSRQAASVEWAAAQRMFAAYGAAGRARQIDARLGGEAKQPRAAVLATFRGDGGLRSLGFASATVTVPDLLGFRYIEYLIRHAGEEIAAGDLVAREHPGAQPQQLGLPALDEQARRAYSQRLTEIDEDIADATAMNDLARVELANRDREFLVAELARAAGMGGRIRDLGGDLERARTSVFRTIRYAIERAAQLEPTLGEHLRQSIRTGTTCAYLPDPLTPVTWDV